MPGSGRPIVGEIVGLIAALLIAMVLLVAYSAVAPLFGWPWLQ